jgi:hypothetical protein
MSDVSPAVRTLITKHISSVAQLELILLLRHTPDRWWTPEELSHELRTEPVWLERALSDLCSRGMCEESAESGRRFRFRPNTPAIEQTLDAL